MQAVYIGEKKITDLKIRYLFMAQEEDALLKQKQPDGLPLGQAKQWHQMCCGNMLISRKQSIQGTSAEFLPSRL